MTPSARIRFATRRGTPTPLAGFTLIELVIVVMVLGILAGVAAPRYGAAINRAQLEAAAKQLAADLRRAQSVAQTTATSVVVAIDPATDAYSSTALPNLDRPTELMSEDIATRGHGVEILSSTFGADTDLEFNFRGEPVAAGAVTLAAAGGLSAVISVNEAGLVEVSL